MEPLRGRVQKVQKVQRVQRVWYRLTAMSMKSALRNFLLCLQCCIMESRSPLPQEGGVTVRRRRIEASILGKKFGPILRASPSSFLGKEPALRESPSYCISHAKHGGSENHKTGLAPVGNAPLSPPSAVLPPKGETTHYDLCVAVAPTNHVRCAPRRGKSALRLP